MSAKAYSQGSSCPKLEKGILRIYGMRFCPYVKRVLLVLAAKDIMYEVVNINLENKPDWFLKKNSSGKVPVLEQDDKIINESLIIADYLDDVYPKRKLNPRDPYLYAKNRMIIQEFGKIGSNILTNIFGQSQELLSFWSHVKDLKYLEDELSNNTTFFGGDKPGMVDYMIWPWFEFIPSLRTLYPEFPLISESHYPLLVKWINYMTSDPSVQKIAISPTITASFIKTKINGHADYDAGL